ncbi:MAG: hypothetical protein ABR554_01735, partial [Pyrinomonadaceae bacterium]
SVTSAPATLAEFEEGRRIGKVSSAEFSRRLGGAALVVRRSLAWLPESPLKREIDNAFRSYADGLWWWQRGERPLVVKAAGGNIAEQNFAAMTHLTNGQIGYNAVVNLRHARECARRADALLDAELKRIGLALKE